MAEHSVGARRTGQQWETLDGLELCSRKKARPLSRDLKTEVRITHTTRPNLVWKLLFQLRSQISLNSSASKYLVFVISHWPTCLTFLISVHITSPSSPPALQDAVLRSQQHFLEVSTNTMTISTLVFACLYQGLLRWLELWRSHVWGLLKIISCYIGLLVLMQSYSCYSSEKVYYLVFDVYFSWL